VPEIADHVLKILSNDNHMTCDIIDILKL